MNNEAVLYWTWLPTVAGWWPAGSASGRACCGQAFLIFAKISHCYSLRNRQHMLSGCYVRNITEGKDFKGGKACLKRDDTRTETRCGLSAKRTSPFKLAGGGVSSVNYWQPRCAHQQ